MSAVFLDDARLGHLEPQVVAFTGALAHAGEHREPAVLGGDVVDELHDDDGLADAGTAEQADLCHLCTYGSRRSMTLMPVSDISSLVLCSVKPGGGRWMGRWVSVLTSPFLSTGYSENVEHASERLAPDREP